METIKTSIYIGCIMGIITVIIDILVPEGGDKKQLNTIMGIISIMAVVSPFLSSGFKISLNEYENNGGNEYLSEQTEQTDTTQLAIVKGEEKYEEYFKDKLNNNDIEVIKLEVNMSINNEQEVEAESVQIWISEDKEYQVEQLVKEDLPQAEILVTILNSSSEESNETLQH